MKSGHGARESPEAALLRALKEEAGEDKKPSTKSSTKSKSKSSESERAQIRTAKIEELEYELRSVRERLRLALMHADADVAGNKHACFCAGLLPSTSDAAGSPPPPLPSASSSSPIPIGAAVQLYSLKAKPELNGQRGVVVDFNADSERCKVTLEDGRRNLMLKPENLIPMIPIGARVELHGLKAKPELNGQRGVVVNDFSADSGRCQVKLEGSIDGRRSLMLKPGNLSPIASVSYI